MAQAQAMMEDLVLGSHDVIVAELQKRLEALSRGRDSFMVAVVGHGGRDTWLSMPLLQAAATGSLRGRVHVRILSSTWQNDRWEGMMQQFLEEMESNGNIAPGMASFKEFQYQRDYSVMVTELAALLEPADLVVQAEQGVDIFVPPGRFGKSPLEVPFLQDNFEDWFMVYEGMKHACKKGAPMWMFETNPVLDIGAGIDAHELNQSIFGGNMQDDKSDCEILLENGPVQLINVCLTLRDATLEERKSTLEKIGVSLDSMASAHSVGFYASLAIFASLKAVSVPVQVTWNF